jgi:hypothetical protein
MLRKERQEETNRNRYLYYNITSNVLHVSIPKGIIIREPTKAIPHKTKLQTFVHSRHDVKERSRQFFVV